MPIAAASLAQPASSMCGRTVRITQSSASGGICALAAPTICARSAGVDAGTDRRALPERRDAALGANASCRLGGEGELDAAERCERGAVRAITGSGGAPVRSGGDDVARAQAPRRVGGRVGEQDDGGERIAVEDRPGAAARDLVERAVVAAREDDLELREIDAVPVGQRQPGDERAVVEESSSSASAPEAARQP
jgi:hypothetical protein